MRKIFIAIFGVAAGCYAGYVALTYWRHNRVFRPSEDSVLLDSFMPEYEVRECHEVKVQAPADVVFAAARRISFHQSPLVRLIFTLREIPARLMSTAVEPVSSQSLMDEVIALGWRQIAEVPQREIIMGAVTQPWKQNVEFHGLAADEFIAFDEPDYAKIAWTLEVEPLDDNSCVFRTETRVSTTDEVSREKFRRYWSFLSPGIIIIRYEILRLVKAEAQPQANLSTL